MKKEIKRTTGEVLQDFTIVEQVYDPDGKRVAFLVSDNWKIKKHKEYPDGDIVYQPYKASNSLISNGVILLPTKAEPYGDIRALLADIKRYIHKYVDLDGGFEDVCCYYVLLSWVYDGFSQLGYLRRVGDLGTGKSRFLTVLGSICYKPIFASGSSSTAAIFHMLDKIRGTLILDEADFRYSDEKADLTKVLNNGFMKGFPVLRCATSKDKEFDPVAYQVYGCKVVASRKPFIDPALESRFITEEKQFSPLRASIPIDLPANFQSEALVLRNKLLRYRFDMLREVSLFRKDADFVDVEPRISQILKPLLQLSVDPKFDELVRSLARDLSRTMLRERSSSIESHVLVAIKSLSSTKQPLSVGEVANQVLLEFSDQHDRNITAKWVGFIVSKSLGLRTIKKCGKFYLANCQYEQLETLYQRYGV